MFFSFCCEAAGMVASMTTLQNRFASRSKVRCLFAAEYHSNFACCFCLSAKTQKNCEEPPLERIRREMVFLSPLIEATLCGLNGEEANVASIHQPMRG
jgi:hypothetical protein